MSQAIEEAPPGIVSEVPVSDIPPNNTVYLNNLNEKIKIDGFFFFFSFLLSLTRASTNQPTKQISKRNCIP